MILLLSGSLVLAYWIGSPVEDQCAELVDVFAITRVLGIQGNRLKKDQWSGLINVLVVTINLQSRNDLSSDLLANSIVTYISSSDII